MTSPKPLDGAAGFVVLVPVKAWQRAKTRLTLWGDPVPEGLPAAFARDAVAAAVASPLVSGVYVVTDQPGFEPDGAHVLADEGDGDLNVALSRAADRVSREHPGTGVAALLADLPCLRTEHLTQALGTRAPRGRARWFVADANGTGTTLLAALPGVRLDPHFGPGSAGRHAGSGAGPVAGELLSLRLDVDTAADLERAVAVGTGPRTTALLRDLRRPPGPPGAPASPA